MKKLPIGIQDIGKILKNGEYVYVDKTAYALKLLESGPQHYFLSRPRRFGKSLFVSVMENILGGNKELFKGCAIYDSQYTWPKHPVIHLDFSQIANHSPEALTSGIAEMLAEIAANYTIEMSGDSFEAQLRRLLQALAKQFSHPVAILIDEYDQPIINNLEQLEIAKANRKVLKNFYSVLKGADRYIAFTLVTGISKFSQVSLFSGPNYLKDITMDEEYAALLGYTDQEVVNCFKPFIERIAHNQSSHQQTVLQSVKEWYNGYQFCSNATSVYNPYSTLNFMQSGQAESYWYQSGTPSFLIDQVRKHPKSIAPLSGTTSVKSKLMNIKELDDIDLTALMFQTGYLTILSSSVSGLFTLGFPNKEVSQAFTESLAECFAKVSAKDESSLKELLECAQIPKLFRKLQNLFSGFPYHLFSRAKEDTYHLALLSILRGIGLAVRSEEPTNTGRIDLVIEMTNIIYVIELKLDASAATALEQIISKQYIDKFLGQGKQVIAVGINFSATERNMNDWKYQIFSESGQPIDA